MSKKTGKRENEKTGSPSGSASSSHLPVFPSSKSSTAGQPGSASRECNASQGAGANISRSASLAGSDSPANHGAGSLSNPLALLLPYQAKWVADSARFKIGCWSRQVGKSFACAAEIVQSALATAKTEWVVLSAGERQALEFMRKVKEWSEAWKLTLAEDIELRDSAEALLKSAEVSWPNGSRILALPANPDTARGYSANLCLDEFAFHENPDEIWRAIYPSISNPLKGQKSIRIVSTPNGMGNKFHDLWAKPNNWSKHKVTIHDAIAAGLGVNLDELRAGLDDPDGWAQEFECEFMDAAAVLLPYELIATCESAEAHASAPPEFFNAPIPGSRLYCGIDFGRRKDLTVCWTFERIGDVLHTREVLELRTLDTPAQIELLRPRLRRASRVCLDYTGPGVGLGDFLAKEFGEWNPEQHRMGRIELCNFTNPLKVDIFSKLRMAFEKVALRVPVNRAIREDLHSMQRVTTPTGNLTYRAPHTEDGHADRCTALALAVRAGAGSGGALTGVEGIKTGGNPTRGAAQRFKPWRMPPRA